MAYHRPRAFRIATLFLGTLLLPSNPSSAGQASRKFSCKIHRHKTNDYVVQATLDARFSVPPHPSIKELRDLKLNYRIFEVDDTKPKSEVPYIWHEQTLTIDKVKANHLYRPRRFFGYLQFPKIGGHQVFGKIDLLLSPKEATAKGTFNGRLIFSNLLDHWGGSAPLHCEFEGQ